LKKYILIIIVVLASFKVSAQNGFNYASYGIGFGASLNHPYADLKKADPTASFNANFTYYYTPYIPIALELQLGTLSGGSKDLKLDASGRRYVNKYKTLMIHMDVQLGEVIDYDNSVFLNAVKNFYAGAGIGALVNDVNAVRISPVDPNYRFPGHNKSIDMIVPLRIGYEFKIYNAYDEPNVRLDIGYIHNVTFGDGLDGYGDPSSKFKNNAPDQYTQISIGIKFLFGGETSYRRSIY
jgi:hypothetical protein